MKPDYTVAAGALDGVETFLRVAARRSFRQAADDLGISPSAVSQAIKGLEARLGVALFTRTTRSVGLTEAGERFLARARPAVEELVAARDAARELAQRPSGLLRLASGAIAPWRVQDAEREIDMTVSGPLIVDDFPTMLGAALGGVGLAQVPGPIASADVRAGRLEEVLAACAPMTAGVFLYHPGRRQVLPKLRAFIDHVKASPPRAVAPAARPSGQRTHGIDYQDGLCVPGG